ncbi:MAG: hypothetical protein GY761_15625 [Hyphomicrobiales bacterium]|nr:hypothetical protein [Hyphomicrobiales bacterium]
MFATNDVNHFFRQVIRDGVRSIKKAKFSNLAQAAILTEQKPLWGA